MRSPLAVALLLAAPMTALAGELSAGAGALLITTQHGEGRFGDLYVTPELRGRASLGPVLLDGQLLASVPASADAFFSSTLTARVGYDGRTWSISAGPAVQWNPSAPSPIQLLPSVRSEARFGRWGFAAGLFDTHGLVPLHVSFLFDQHELGFVAPLGGLLRTSFRVGEATRIGVQALGFQLFDTQLFLVTVSGILGGQEVTP